MKSTSMGKWIVFEDTRLNCITILGGEERGGERGQGGRGEGEERERGGGEETPRQKEQGCSLRNFEKNTQEVTYILFGGYGLNVLLP